MFSIGAHSQTFKEVSSDWGIHHVAEFPIFLGVWKISLPGSLNVAWPFAKWVGPMMAIIASISIVITAGYILRMIRRVFFGDVPEEHEHLLTPTRVTDKIALVMLASILIILGAVWLANCADICNEMQILRKYFGNEIRYLRRKIY